MSPVRAVIYASVGLLGLAAPVPGVGREWTTVIIKTADEVDATKATTVLNGHCKGGDLRVTIAYPDNPSAEHPTGSVRYRYGSHSGTLPPSPVVELIMSGAAVWLDCAEAHASITVGSNDWDRDKYTYYLGKVFIENDGRVIAAGLRKAYTGTCTWRPADDSAAPPAP